MRVGIFGSLRTKRGQQSVQGLVADGIAAGKATDPRKYPFASPWTQSQPFERWAFENEILGTLPYASRDEAMSLPPWARGRNLIVTQLAGLPLLEGEFQWVTDQATGERNRVFVADEEQPTWTTQTGDGSSPELRNAWSADDVMHDGRFLWWRENNRDGSLAAAMRVNPDEWELNHERREILVNGTAADASEVILFTGLHEGALFYGADTIRGVKQLYVNVRKRIKNAVQMIDLHQTGGPELTEKQIDDLIDGYAAAREGLNGGVGFSNQWIDVRELGSGADSQLLIEARNAAAVELAQVLGIHASNVDATVAKASLNYETTTGRNQELVDFDLSLYTLPFWSRLSMDDICAPGKVVRFDMTQLTSLTPDPAGPASED